MSEKEIKAEAQEEGDEVEDFCKHIALVRDHETGKAMAKYGFDSYCILEKDTMKPIYYKLEKKEK